MKFCTKCGEACSDDAAYCFKCGEKISNTDEWKYQYVDEDLGDFERVEKQERGLIIVSIVVFVLILIIFGPLLIDWISYNIHRYSW